MRLQIVNSKNASSFYVVKSIYENKKRSSKVIEKLGTYDELIKKSNSKFQEKKFELSKQKKIQEEFFKNLYKDVAQVEDVVKNMYKRLGE